MEKIKLLIKEFWEEIIIISLLVVFSKYLIKILPFLKGWVGLFMISFSIGIIGGYLIVRKNETNKTALLIPGIIIILFFIISGLYAIISFVFAGDEYVLEMFAKDPKWINYSVNKLRYMSIGGALVSLGMVCPILFIFALFGAKIGKKIKEKLTKS
ncbi:hypothetical protein KAI68_05780 [bacterium]|nr:hypothetical protein [bacterium]